MVFTTKATITNNTANDLTDYQVKITLTSGYCDFSVGASGVWVEDVSGNPLYYWIESFDSSNNQAVIWVKVPLIPGNGSVVVYVKCDSNNPYSSYNDPNKVFLLFDHFDIDELDTTKWEIMAVTGDNGNIDEVTSDDVCVSDGMVKLDCQNANKAGVAIVSQESFTAPITIETRFMVTGDDDSFGLIFALEDETWKYEAVVNYGDHSWGSYTGLATKNPDWQEDWGCNCDFVGSTNVWYKLRVDFYDTGKAKMYIDDDLIEDSYANQDGLGYVVDSGRVGVASHHLGYGAYVDYVIVRKYAETEPSVSLVIYRQDYMGQISYSIAEEFKVMVNTRDSVGQVTYTITESLTVVGPKNQQDNVGQISYSIQETLSQDVESLVGTVLYSITESLTQTGAVDTSDLVGQVAYSITETLSIQGAVDTQDKVGQITYTVSETLSVGGAVSTQDKVGQVTYSIVETLTERGAVDTLDNVGQITYTITEAFSGSTSITSSVGQISYTITETLSGISTLPIIDVLTEPVRLEKLESNGIDGYAVMQAPKTLLEAKNIGFNKFFPLLAKGSLLGVFRIFKEERVPYGEGYRYYLKDPISFIYTIIVSVKWSGSLLDNVVSLLSRYLKSISIVKDANATDIQLDSYVFKGKLGELLLDLKDKYGVIIYYDYDPTTTATSIVVSRKQTYTLVGDYKNFIKTVIEETSNICTRHVVVSQSDTVVEVLNVSLTYSGTSADLVWNIERVGVCMDSNCKLREDLDYLDPRRTVNILATGSYTDSSGNTVYYADIEILHYVDSSIYNTLDDPDIPTCPNFWIAFEDTIRDISVWGDAVALKRVRIETTNTDVSCPDTTNPEFYVRYYPNTSPVILENNVATYGERYCNVDYETIQTLNDYNALEPSLLAKSSPNQVLDVVVPLVLLAEMEGNISKVVGSKHADVTIGSKLFTGLVVSDLKIKNNVVEMRLSTHDVPFPATVLRQNLPIGGFGRAKNIFPV